MNLRHSILALLTLSVAVTLTSCFGRKKTPVATENLTMEKLVTQGTARAAALSSGDQLDIAVYDGIRSAKKVMHETLTVSPEGTIEIPKVGAVQVAEKSLISASDAIASAYRRVDWASGLRSTIHIFAINGNPTVTIEGAVTSPGVYTFKKELDLNSASALAGGKTGSANDAYLYLIRKGVQNTIAIDRPDITLLEEGDILRIPKGF